MRKAGLRAGVDLLRKVEEDLQRLPRHQWDSYLWDFCNRFVSQRRHADGVTSPLHNSVSRQESD
jgi:hypothetical protein